MLHSVLGPWDGAVCKRDRNTCSLEFIFQQGNCHFIKDGMNVLEWYMETQSPE